MVATVKIAEYDLTSPAYRAAPFPTYARMRRQAPWYCVDEDGPVPWTRGRVWYVMASQQRSSWWPAVRWTLRFSIGLQPSRNW